MTSQNQSKAWCFTINNYGPNEPADLFNRLEGSYVYVVVGKEVCPTTGTPHLQGYVLFRDRKRLKTVKKLIGNRAHLERAKGNPEQNHRYCSKEGNYEERGTLPTGKHTTLSVVCEKLKAGTPLREIALNQPETFVRHHRGLQRLVEVLGESTQRSWKTTVVVYIGTTGVGKSRKCAELCGSEPTYYKPRGKWWDGYDGQPNVIIDDFYGWIEYDEMLRITDRYPHRVPVKFGFTQFLAKSIFITSNKPVSEWYTFEGYRENAISPLLRRIDKIHLINKPLYDDITFNQ